MLILAIESSGVAASAAIVGFDIINNKKNIIAEFSTNSKLTHSETLVPLIKSMFEFARLNIKEIDYVACSSGPGSFTGLRIGVSVAKAIAGSLKKSLINVPTLDAMAYNLLDFNGIIVPMIDAKKNQVYTAFYDFNFGSMKRISEYMAISFDEAFEKLNNKKNIIFLGDGAENHKDFILLNYKLASAGNNFAKASSVGLYAIDNLDKKIISYKEFVPMYIRPSQAEQAYNAKL